MIDFIKGQVIFKYRDSVSLLCGDIAFRIFVPSDVVKEVREEDSLELFTKLIFPAEGAPSLYGFRTREERTVFEELLKIPKVGSKVAMNIISHFSCKELQRIISSEDVETLSTVPGLGKKLSERIVLELRGKIREKEALPEELFAILTSLGYSRKEITSAIGDLNVKDKPIEELVKEVVKRLSGRKF